MENTRGAGPRTMTGVGMMKLSAAWRHGGLWMALMVPIGVFAAPAGSAPDTASARVESDDAVRPIQLAAAIGIVKPESSELPPPAEPAVASPPSPVAESGPAVDEATTGDVAASDESGGSRSRTILIGAGVAALLGALAGGGGGGGGGSSTPQH